jgi:uncharacterized protein YutE (UPF0331/DUF86 family)
MADRDLILAKAGAIEKYLNRIKIKRETDLKTFLADIDRQESVLFNLQMAIQNCIDIAAHIVSDEGIGVPGSTNEMFYLLEEHGLLGHQLVEKMVKAVGFRNLVVHEYGKVDLEQVFDIAHKGVDDLQKYIASVLKLCC